MKQRFSALSLTAALLLVVGLAGATFAQDAKDTLPAHPRYAVLPPHGFSEIGTPTTPLTTWNGTFTYQSITYKYNMVGTAPSTGTSTTIAVFIIPVALQYKSGSTTTTYTPETTQSNGKTAVANTTGSPIFQDMDWVAPNGTVLGTTQYEDAFQRGNFWGQVSSATGYHVLFAKPKLAPVQTFLVPVADGSQGTEFGVKVGLADINWFDSTVVQPLITKFKIPANAFPIFMTYNVYLTSGGECCIGGYHSATSAATPGAYGVFSYVGTPGAFAQDVGALSHEAGEFIDDPLVVNRNGNIIDSKCAQINGSDILEVGDPEEVFANYGDFPYTFNGFTYHLQDLVYLEYFGAPNTTSVGGEMTFQNNPFDLTVCSAGG
jgi:hypothetical protein